MGNDTTYYDMDPQTVPKLFIGDNYARLLDIIISGLEIGFLYGV